MNDYVNVSRYVAILYRRSQLFVVEACQKMNLTFSEYILLLRVFDNEGAKQDELASMLYLDKAVVTRTVNMLQEKGLIYRQQDELDRRVKHIFLTEQGKAKHKYLQSVLNTWVEHLVEGMSKDEADTLFSNLHRLVDRACNANLIALAKTVNEGSFDE